MFALRSISEYRLAETIRLLNYGFSDYIVPVRFDLGLFLHLVRYGGVDLTNSRIISDDGKALGVALIARRGWSSRLATMALVPEARGQGGGKWFMRQLIEESQNRGERRMVLEVIEQNTTAVRLYLGCGFQIQRRLLGYNLVKHPEGLNPVELKEVDFHKLGRKVIQYGMTGLPWQISGESLVQDGPPSKAFQLEGSYVAISDPDQPDIKIRSLLVEPESRGQGLARQLLEAVISCYPDKNWRVSAHYPEEIGRVFEKAGFERGAVSQFQMVMEY